MTDTTKAEFFAIVELFGHTKLAGFVSEYTLGGQSFVRVEVPETKLQKGFTRLLGNGAIYAINPVAEDICKSMAERLQVKPISEWDLPDGYREAIRSHQKLLAAVPVPAPGEPDFSDAAEEYEDE